MIEISDHILTKNRTWRADVMVCELGEITPTYIREFPSTTMAASMSRAPVSQTGMANEKNIRQFHEFEVGEQFFGKVLKAL